MSANEMFDWDAWYTRYRLEADMLHEARSLFPAVLGHRQMQQLDPDAQWMTTPLSNHEIYMVLAAESDEEDVVGSFESYLERGEIQAAMALVSRASKHKEAQPSTLNRLVSQRQQELELEFGRLHARATRAHQDLVQAGILSHDDQRYAA